MGNLSRSLFIATILLWFFLVTSHLTDDVPLLQVCLFMLKCNLFVVINQLLCLVIHSWPKLIYLAKLMQKEILYY